MNQAKTPLKRQSLLMENLKESRFEALVLNAGPSLKYFTGLDFHLMERPILVFFKVGQAPTFVLPEFETGKLEELDYEKNVFTYDEEPANWQASFDAASKKLALSKNLIGVEDTSLRILEHRFIEQSAEGATFESASDLISSSRQIKDASEQEAMAKAAQIAEEALARTLPIVALGISEKEIAAKLVQEMLTLGSDAELPFFPIVASGPNSANPHASITDRKLVKGDLLLIDWGASTDGYFSDLTRTFAIQELDDELRKVHALVVAANAADKAAVKPGVTCESVDQAGRKIINEAGYEQYFQTRTGHGLGMEVHEEPYIRDGNKKILQIGMTFTIEPGIYMPTRGGVRIEDDVVVTKDGVRSFTQSPRDLQILA